MLTISLNWLRIASQRVVRWPSRRAATGYKVGAAKQSLVSYRHHWCRCHLVNHVGRGGTTECLQCHGCHLREGHLQLTVVLSACWWIVSPGGAAACAPPPARTQRGPVLEVARSCWKAAGARHLRRNRRHVILLLRSPQWLQSSLEAKMKFACAGEQFARFNSRPTLKVTHFRPTPREVSFKQFLFWFQKQL